MGFTKEPQTRYDMNITVFQLSLTPYCGMGEHNKWYTMVAHKGWPGDDVKLKLSITMEKPANVKKSG